MSEGPRRTKGVHTGPRSRRVVESVQAATMRELVRVGYARMTVGSVAAEAGVARTTIYRRWPTKADLVASLLEPQFARFDAAAPAGTLAEELTRLIRVIAVNLMSPEGQAIVLVLNSPLPELKALVAQSRERAMALFVRAFHDAEGRGELPHGVDVEMLVHLAFVGGVQWVTLRERAPTDEECARLVRAVLASVP